jgi:hypothetical protein
MQNGAIDEIIIEKIMSSLDKRAPLTRMVYEGEFKKIVALVRLCEADMKMIEKHMISQGLITRSGSVIYFR